MLWFFGGLGLLALFGYALWQIYFQGEQTVEPGRRERLVVQDNLGNTMVLGPGKHFLAPQWRPLQLVSINREPVAVSKETVKTADGNRLQISYRYDIIVGRRFNRTNGVLSVPEDEVDDESHVDDNLVRSTVTTIDFPNFKTHVGQRVEAVIEATLGHYGHQQLTTPGAQATTIPEPGELIPPNDWMGAYVTADIVRSAAELYRQLALLIKLRVNFELRFVGINVVGFQITNLLYEDELVQKALEAQARQERLGKAVTGLTGAQVLAANTDQFGNVAIGEGLRDLGKGIAEGLKNFGKGPQQPPQGIP